MADPTLDQRTPICHLKYEADDARNYNWSKIDDTIGRAFTPDSPLQLPPIPPNQVITPPTGLAPTAPISLWGDPLPRTVANTSAGYLLDARNLVLVDGHTYKMLLVGDISRIANVGCTLVVWAGGTNPFSYTLGGTLASARTEVFAIEMTVIVQGTTLRIYGVMRSAVATPATVHNAAVVASTIIISCTTTMTGLGIYAQGSWEVPDPGNIAHTMIGTVECV